MGVTWPTISKTVVPKIASELRAAVRKFGNMADKVREETKKVKAVTSPLAAAFLPV